MLLRSFILGGLIVHKLVWVALKKQAAPSRAPRPTATPGIRLVRAIKISILLGLAAQTLMPPVLPFHSTTEAWRIAGLVLYTAGLALAITGRVQLGRNWSDIEAATVRPDHAVISTGVYRYIRHPIYTGDLALLLGMELALGSWLFLGVLLLIPIVVRKAVLEEQGLAAAAPGYRAYCDNTSRFLPSGMRVFPRSSR